MVSIHKDKRSIESDELYKLLLQINIQTIGDSLFTKSITQKRKKMEMRTKERRKFLISNRKHIEREQNTFL